MCVEAGSCRDAASSNVLWINGLSSFPRVCEAEESENTLPITEPYGGRGSHVHLILHAQGIFQSLCN